jgi:valyl-tRNA synthetase
MRKLANPQFVEKAPLEVLEKSRAKLAEAEVALTKLDEAIGRLGV